MITFYFVRHGETIFNVYKRMQGWCDTPLTKRGVEQARDVALGLRNVPFTKVYTSDSGRALETAHFIASEKDLTPIAMKGFRELFFGTCEGLDTYTGRLKEKEFRDKNGWVNVGGENMDMLEERLFHSINEVISNQEYMNEHVIVVTHGLAIMAIVRHLDCLFFQQLKEDYGEVLKNVSVTTVTYEHGIFKLKDFNNTQYVENGGKLQNEKNHK